MSEYDPQGFGRMVASNREFLGMSLREVSEDTGIAVSTLHRVEHGRSSDVQTYLTLMAWVGKPVNIPVICPRCSGTGRLKGSK